MIQTSQIAALALDYNTDREDLRMPEYGRHVQSMIAYCLTLPDREHRTKVANSIIDVIGNLNPGLRDNPDYRHKLWDHLFVMSNFELDVDCPYPTPTREKLTPTMEKLKERSDEGNVRLTPDEGNVRQNFLLDPDEKIVQGDSKLTERRIKCRHEMITVS